MNNKDYLKLSNEESNRITREALEIALFELLENKSIDEISITELVRKAGVSRSAFYRNYETKDALMISISQNAFDRICDFIKSNGFSENKIDIFYSFFKAIKRNEKNFRIYLNSPFKMEQLVGEVIKPSKTNKEHYEIVAKEGAFYNVLVNWFNNGMKESEMEMAKICSDILNFYNKGD